MFPRAYFLELEDSAYTPRSIMIADRISTTVVMAEAFHDSLPAVWPGILVDDEGDEVVLDSGR